MLLETWPRATAVDLWGAIEAIQGRYMPDFVASGLSLCFEQEDCAVSQVEIDKVFCFYH